MKSHLLTGLAFSLVAGLGMTLGSQAAAAEFYKVDHSMGSFHDLSQKPDFKPESRGPGGESYKDYSEFGFHSGKGLDWSGGSWSYHAGHGAWDCDPITAVPEPGTVPIMLSGLALLGLVVARRRNAV